MSRVACGRPGDQRHPRRERRHRHRHQQGARERRGRVRRLPRPRRRVRSRCIARLRLASQRAATDRHRLYRRGQDRPPQPAERAVLQARLVAGALPRRDVRRSPARRPPLARRGGRPARSSLRRRPGLRADAPPRRAHRPDRARLADPLPLAKAAGEPRRRGRREAGHLAAAGGGGQRPSRAVRRGRVRPAPSDAAPPRDDPSATALALAPGDGDRPDPGCPGAARQVPRLDLHADDLPELLGPARRQRHDRSRRTGPVRALPRRRRSVRRAVQLLACEQRRRRRRRRRAARLPEQRHRGADAGMARGAREPGRARRGRCRRAAAGLPERHGPARRGRPRAPRDGRSHHARLSEWGRRLRRFAFLHA